MAFVDVIDDYTQGATGTLTDGDGQSVGYTVTDGAQTINQAFHGDNSAKIGAQGQDTVLVTFDQPVIGASVTFQGSDVDEFYNVIIDGVVVDLADMIASGDASFANVGTTSTHTINPDGTISGGQFRDGSVGQIVFNIPITSLGAVGSSGQSPGNFDGVEIGLDDTVFDIVCFAGGTLILTPSGPQPVEALREGDLICTRDGTDKPIRWLGSRRFSAGTLGCQPHLYPVRITAGALGHGLPERDLLVSRQHRVLVSSKVAARMFGETDVLIAAIKLTALPGIYIDEEVDSITYFHILLDDHEVLFAEGTPTESLFAGPEGLKSLPAAARAELFAIFPQLADQALTRPHACLIPSGKMQRQLVDRHLRNNKPLLELFTG
ncbi:Hint domain-containing protein [Yoonia sp. BS5-3]|uniref:Hint domain-containing protein n=1 Tax=Yoonia phaeophyticola TaxID=3137369 RepID=A0ABZ2V876_9RHOB